MQTFIKDFMGKIVLEKFMLQYPNLTKKGER
jgi:hypothetical protein